jgi:dihydrofolate reductase
MKVSIIVAATVEWVIGKDDALPWHIPEDFKWFKKHTGGRPVIMGRKTYESIGRLLPDRENVILTRRNDYRVRGAIIFHSLEEAIHSYRNRDEPEVFIIGGASVYREALPFADRIYLTVIEKAFEGDVFFPSFSKDDYHTVLKEPHTGDIPFTFYILEKKQ